MGNEGVYDLSLIREVIARKDFARFCAYVYDVSLDPFHKTYYDVLNLFAHGIIKKLIVSMPPQHGKSLGASQLLPAYMLGINPDEQVAIASYSASLATRFSRRVQRIMLGKQYLSVFPQTKLKSGISAGAGQGYSQTSDAFDVVNHKGGLMAVGREGSLTGNRVDTFILDDLYKDAMEAFSPTVRENCWEWYTSVVRTRMHNASRELIVFTRWHEEDLIGTLEKIEPMRPFNSFEDVDPDYNGWYKLNLEAIKESAPTPIDPRPAGAALWPAQHSIETLVEKRKLDPIRFDCMYQGHPATKEGLLYGEGFRTYDSLPVVIERRGSYTDTADTGEDYLCSICYCVGKDGLIYITDALFTQEPMEVTETAVASMLKRNASNYALIESNNGGRGFARAVARFAPQVRMEWFHQSANKEARILSHAATVLQYIVFPADWKVRWQALYDNLSRYKRRFRANRTHDAADVVTGIIEKEIIKRQENKVLKIGFRN